MNHDYEVRTDGPQEIVVCHRCGMQWLMEFSGYVDTVAAEADRDCENDTRQPERNDGLGKLSVIPGVGDKYRDTSTGTEYLLEPGGWVALNDGSEGA